jgi:glutamate synthase domain-containing protein 3
LGIGTTNPTSTLQVQGTVSVSSTTTSAEFVGGGSELRNLSGTHLVSYASHSETSNSALSIAGISTYNQVGILTGSLAVDASDRFGFSVATSADGKTIVVGAYFDEIGANTSSGVVYVYDRVGTSFNQVGILTGSLAVDTSDNFGTSVATSADGKTIIVGAPVDEIGATTDTGVVYVYDRVGTSFNQVGILTGSLAVDASDQFGTSVATSADGKTIIVGAPADEIGANTSSGVVYVYDRVGTSFNQVGILTGSLAVDTTDLFGLSVATSADGKTIVVGAYLDEIGATTGTGVVYVYDRVGTSFNQVGILTGSLAVDTSDNFGRSVATSADGKTIVVGAWNDEMGANNASGVVYVFNRQGNSFNQVGILTGSLAVDAADLFGFSVATSADGKAIVVGAYQDEIGGTGSTGVVYVFDETRNTYVYSGPTGNIGIGTTNPVGQLQISTGPVIIGAATSTGTASQRLQVTGGAYVSGNLGVGVTAPAFTADIAGDARITSTNKMRFGGTAGTTNFYIQYNSTANSLDFVAG